MNAEQLCYEKKRKNIIDMAVTFSAMMRVFKKGSAKIIKEEIEKTLNNIGEINNHNEFLVIHDCFCNWFLTNISTAQRIKEGKIIKHSGSASYGQGAKVLDVVLKVYVYYSNLPSIDKSKELLPFLNCPVDTPILNYLKDKSGFSTNANCIEEIDKYTYFKLQDLIEPQANIIR